MERVRKMVRHHHEYFDGSGYPEKLSGENIPLGSRIIAIADSYDTITSERAYKKPRTSEAAIAELQRCAGMQFDPTIVSIFVAILSQNPDPIADLEIQEPKPESATR
jgi:HD-GYP domain-containing protein (c-di-GMP phosphodiesterase class II)